MFDQLLSPLRPEGFTCLTPDLRTWHLLCVSSTSTTVRVLSSVFVCLCIHRCIFVVSLVVICLLLDFIFCSCLCFYIIEWFGISFMVFIPRFVSLHPLVDIISLLFVLCLVFCLHSFVFLCIFASVLCVVVTHLMFCCHDRIVSLNVILLLLFWLWGSLCSCFCMSLCLCSRLILPHKCQESVQREAPPLDL